MQTVVLILQIVISILLVGLISIQGKGGGLGSAFGAGYSSFSKRRGIEKFVFQFTILITALFLVVSILNLAR
ncbi:preprotein translocase subunit SecG [Candidatus Roizmanbacteria bacterium]|nr:preprotein translocase subunit SecG [Candidatus Roizmanbacteria bacterium]